MSQTFFLRRIRIRHVLTGMLLVAAWCALWGSFSIANLASGTAIAALVLGAGIGSECRGGVRMVPLMRLGALVFVDLVRSTASVASSVVAREDRVDEAIIAVELPVAARRHLLLMVCAVTVTPGTAVVDADPDDGTLYLHVLHADQIDEVRRHVEQLAELADQALPYRPSDARSTPPTTRLKGKAAS